MAPKARTRAVPNRSATIPASGWVTPQQSACNANDKPNTSRPQPRSADIGRKNTPKVAENPKLMKATMQPAVMAALATNGSGSVAAILVAPKHKALVTIAAFNPAEIIRNHQPDARMAQRATAAVAGDTGGWDNLNLRGFTGHWQQLSGFEIAEP